MNNQQKTITPRVVIQLLLFIVLVPFLPLLISRQWGWWEGWLFALLNILSFAISRMLAARRHPDLLAERARFMRQEDTEPWDKKLAPLLGLGGGLLPLVAGLDALYGWSPSYNVPAKVVALLIILAGYALASYALIENRYFSGTVRIQSERGHKVVSGGPYRWVRHPGYAGALWSYVATPVFLDAPWAFLPAAFLMMVMAVRTRLEDMTLQNKLEGYRDYAKEVRYRLVPGVW
jgi:protein-S-isoprenylcysteine O-methyltransferase Ste14